MNENQRWIRLIEKFVVSLLRHLILINYDCRVQNQEFLLVAG